MRHFLLPSRAQTLFSTVILLWALIPVAAQAAAADSATRQDACFDHGRVSERACSDLIAALAAGSGLSAADHQALISAYNNRGLARTRAGELELAAEDLAEAVSLAPDNWAVYLNRGNLMLASDQPQAALADFQRAADLAVAAEPAALANSILAHRAMLDTASAAQALTALRQLTMAATPADVRGAGGAKGSGAGGKGSAVPANPSP